MCRHAVVEDSQALARVWVDAWRRAYAGLMPADYLAALDPMVASEQFAHAIRSGPSTLVIEHDAAVVGFTVYGPSRDEDAAPDTGEVIAVNLAPSHWRRGLGTMLVQETVRRLEQRGFSQFTLWVLRDNMGARQFYEASGWIADGGEKHDDKLTGFPLHEIRYRRIS